MNDSSIQFNHLESLHWLWLVVAIAALVAWAIASQRRRLLRFASAAVLGRLVPDSVSARRVTRAILAVAAMFAIVLALLDPRWGVTYEEVQQQGIDLIVVLDVSRSMLAEDARPNRLDRSRAFIGDLLEELGGDRVGLITCAGDAALSCPLTLDYGALRLSMAEVSPRSATRGGSLLGDALRVAGESFTDEVKDHKVVILFTDGEDHGSYPIEAARQLWEERGVRVYTVGIGDDGEGARIPVGTGPDRVFLVHDGQEVWSKMESAVLRDMALAGGGAFIGVGTGTADLGRIYQEIIAPTTRRALGATRVRRFDLQFQWFAALALLLLLAEAIVGDRPGTVLRRGAMPASMALLLVVSIGAAPVASPAPKPTPSPAPTAPSTSSSVRRQLDRINEALAREDYAAAAGLYDQLRTALPDAPQVPFNQGVARYRSGEYDLAAEAFNRAAELADDPSLRARSLFNLGNAALAQSRAALRGQGDPAQAQQQMQAAGEKLGEALEQYKSALAADPADEDSRANAELAWRMLRRLEEIQEQQQQQQQQEGEGEQSEPQEGEGEQSEPQEGEGEPSEQQQGEGEPSEEQQSEGEPSEEQQQPGEPQEDQQEQEQQEQQQADASEDQSDEEEQGRAGTADEERPMTREEAERLLQMVRDKQRERRLEQAEKARARQPQVEKDW